MTYAILRAWRGPFARAFPMERRAAWQAWSRGDGAILCGGAS